MKITVELTEEEAAALLHFLRVETPYEREVNSALGRASEKTRVALRDKVEPGWRDQKGG